MKAQGQCDNSGLQFECCCLFFCIRQQDGPHMSCCGHFSEVSVRLSHFSFQDFWGRAVLILNDFKSKDGRETKGICLQNQSQMLEETGRIQDPMIGASSQVGTKPQKTMNSTGI